MSPWYFVAVRGIPLHLAFIWVLVGPPSCRFFRGLVGPFIPLNALMGGNPVHLHLRLRLSKFFETLQDLHQDVLS